MISQKVFRDRLKRRSSKLDQYYNIEHDCLVYKAIQKSTHYNSKENFVPHCNYRCLLSSHRVWYRYIVMCLNYNFNVSVIMHRVIVHILKTCGFLAISSDPITHASLIRRFWVSTYAHNIFPIVSLSVLGYRSNTRHQIWFGLMYSMLLVIIGFDSYGSKCYVFTFDDICTQWSCDYMYSLDVCFLYEISCVCKIL